jgi:hypothetical protein
MSLLYSLKTPLLKRRRLIGKTIVPLSEERFTQEKAHKWERETFQQACEYGQRQARAYLEELEEALF